MGQVPPYIQRWGITVLFAIVAALLVGCYFFKSPDTLTAEAILTTSTPPVNIVARSTGKLDRVLVSNRELIEAGEVLAVIQNPAKYEDICFLVKNVEDWKNGIISLSSLCTQLSKANLQLGELQNAYIQFLKSVKEYLQQDNLGYYPKKIRMKRLQMSKRGELGQKMQEEKNLGKEQAKLASSLFYRDSILYHRGILTGENYDQARQTYLQSRQTVIGKESSEKQMQMQDMQEEETLLDLEKQDLESTNQYSQALQAATQQLSAQLKSWQQNYVLYSPIQGIVNLIGLWSRNQNVTAGETAFVVIPQHPDAPIGKALFPAAGAGKVMIKQKVNVRLSNFPDAEFGYLEGVVKSISDIPTADGLYLVEIAFPNGLQTNYGKQLPTTQQMSGTAQVVIKEQRLIERFIQPIKLLLQEQK